MAAGNLQPSVTRRICGFPKFLLTDCRLLMTNGYSSQDRRLMAIFSMARPELRKKIVLLSITVIIEGVAFIFLWSVLRETDTANTPVSSVSHTSEVLTRLLSDLNLILPISLLAILLGMACAFYLEEWLSATNWTRHFVESQTAFLTGIPSLLYGLLSVVIFFSYVGVFKTTRTMLQHNTALFYTEALIFILMVMPVAIKTTQEALRSVGTPIRESAYALGANRWQVLTKQVVPRAFPWMFAGGCRAMSRALAAAALLIGIYTWNYTTGLRGLPDRFMLFLGGALLLSNASSFLTEIYVPASTQQN